MGLPGLVEDGNAAACDLCWRRIHPGCAGVALLADNQEDVRARCKTKGHSGCHAFAAFGVLDLSARRGGAAKAWHPNQLISPEVLDQIVSLGQPITPHPVSKRLCCEQCVKRR